MSAGLAADLPFHLESRVLRYAAPVAELLGAGTTSLDRGTLTVTYVGGSISRDGVLNRNSGAGAPSAVSVLPELTLLRISMGRAQSTLVLDVRGKVRGRSGVGLTGATGQEILELELDDYSMNYRTIQATTRPSPNPSLPAAAFFVVTPDAIQVPVGTWFDQLLTAAMGVTTGDDMLPGSPDYTSALVRIAFAPPTLMLPSPGILRSSGGANYGPLLPTNRMQSSFSVTNSFIDLGFLPPDGSPNWPARVVGVDAPMARQRYAMHQYPVNTALYSWRATPAVTDPTPLQTLQEVVDTLADPARVFISWSADTRNWSTALSGILHISYRGH